VHRPDGSDDLGPQLVDERPVEEPAQDEVAERAEPIDLRTRRRARSRSPAGTEERPPMAEDAIPTAG
jgi:hypothetical protein